MSNGSPLSFTQIANNVLYGLAYGYAPCCIEDFHRRQVDGRLRSSNKKPVHWKGLVESLRHKPYALKCLNA